jgi:sec-independent protein translocase protein TatC
VDRGSEAEDAARETRLCRRLISQTLLALPMWLLFEVGVFLGERFAPKRDEEDSNDSGHKEYEPPSDEEMDAELDRIEAEEEGRKPE